jgi:hypothetical protein
MREVEKRRIEQVEVHRIRPFPAAIHIVWLRFRGDETAVNEDATDSCSLQVLQRAPQAIKQEASSWGCGKYNSVGCACWLGNSAPYTAPESEVSLLRLANSQGTPVRFAVQGALVASARRAS